MKNPDPTIRQEMPITYVIHEVDLPALTSAPDEKVLRERVGQMLRIKANRIEQLKILRQSLDSRVRNQPRWKYSVEFSFAGEIRHPKAKLKEAKDNESIKTIINGVKNLLPGQRVAIIGSGPAGMAAAWGLIHKGYKVDVFEQGSAVQQRFLDIRRFLKQNIFNADSNILFGEGGAGTFSDGKLTSRTRNPFTEAFLKLLIECGAPENILYLSHPHIGTDKLQFLIKAWREKCLALGCIMHFNTKVADFVMQEKTIKGLVLSSGETLPFDAVVLAAGHSSRILYDRLKFWNVAMEVKPFSVGVRVEHPQQLINTRQLGDKVNLDVTGAAEYFLTFNQEEQGLAAYSFCMCPGGVIVPCADSADGIFTNGMSYSSRGSAFANSAVVVPVQTDDLPSQDVLAGLAYQSDLERKANVLGGGDFTYPIQRISAYMNGQLETGEFPKTSFQKALRFAEFNNLFSPTVNNALHQAFQNFDRKIPGFIATGVIIGPESRTSSPVRVCREANTFASTNISGLYPLGEGAGYSGGIVSSGGDGLKFADTIKAWVG